MRDHPFLQRLAERPLLIDGAMGTMLYARGASSEQCLEHLVVSKPAWVSEIHQAYANAGADILKTHTFGANRIRLADYGLAERVRDLNFRAVRLVRDVREVSGRAIFIAGDVGPLGKRLQPEGPLSATEAEEAFREQISVLWEAGADLLLFETFIDLEELELAVRTARKVCDLPIVASMTFAEDGLTLVGHTPEEAVRRLHAAGADVVGVNCSVGPAAMAQTLEQMHAAAPDVRLIIMPNAGFPERVEGRFYYPASPEYFARQTALFLTQGARIVGGCCGTTPMHIRAMRAALDEHLTVQVGIARPTLVVQEEPPPAVKADYGVTDEVEPTELLRKLRAGKFVISVEVDPPRSFSAEKQIEGARHAMKMGADAVNVADSPMARVRMSALALCVQIQQQVGIETIVHFTTRDRSLMGLQADLIGARALGVRNILALTGDPPTLGDNKQSTAVYDVDSIGLVRIISRFNEGVDVAGQDMGQKGGFTIAVACDPTRADLVQEVDRFHQKVIGGAHFTMTQPIFDPQLWLNFVRLYEERHGKFPVPVLIGVLPLQGHKHATFLHNEVPGITLSEEALERMRKAGPNGRQEGVKMAQELLLELKELPYVQGVYLMPSFGRYETACQVLEVL
ncbi:bifunctional homocysteine S-methyltransferase/methylenetetrahydrofolate reductase [Caldilinea aerophila]|uniref:Putative methylenetetrahydrofolate reductase n=1 Tax=Caldilinea aerophila (strain DSM 14535 / JCM 11387 / NBRC 104270 / STL-6-O1) TaxID=926550 RepID=I0I8I9_CALAS|nr:bifunctional homocysteine S-methyltransferase/methylenetetrahydrofolate reductase [Caldilinea aerophila]BAM01577.1 putative methylenetetrahydrofolate reductase [Caldilinea aerophila DSM 14535 = NBRC 104270]